jgi:anti-sigma B factor antagonist
MGGSWQKIAPTCGSKSRPAISGRYGSQISPIRINSEVLAWFDSLALDLVSLGQANVESSIRVGVNGPTVWVKVEGKGSFLNSGNLKEFAREMLDRGYREFVVDLANCAMMDSTFMGTMASVALRLKELGQGHLRVVHCQSRSRELLSGLGLDQIFDIHGNGATAPECESLERESGDQSRENQKQEQAQTMLEAHEALCEAAPENLFRFKDVLDYLKQDLHHETPSK